MRRAREVYDTYDGVRRGRRLAQYRSTLKTHTRTLVFSAISYFPSVKLDYYCNVLPKIKLGFRAFNGPIAAEQRCDKLRSKCIYEYTIRMHVYT